MKIDELKELLKKFDSSITYSADLKKKNWFNIGGKAKVFFKADELTDLVEFLKVLDNREKIHIIGAGSNTLITDEVYDGVIIKLGKNFNRLSVLNSNIIISGTAVLDKKLSDFAAENSLSGFEFLSCIPGTVGGGLKMNAGCFGTEIKDILVSIQSVDKNGNVLTIPAKEINFEYRNNDLSESLIFLSASFKGEKKDTQKILEKMSKLKNEKDNNQPTKIKTSGSTFKNPQNKFAAELIEKANCKGLKIGDAHVSTHHANFFINSGNANATQIEELGNKVIEKVYKKHSIKLEWEIKIIGNL